MLRTSRAIHTWLLLKHDTAVFLGEARTAFPRCLAKHLLDCSLLYPCKCTRGGIQYYSALKLATVTGQRAPNVGQVPDVEHILDEAIKFLLNTAPSSKVKYILSRAFSQYDRNTFGSYSQGAPFHESKAEKTIIPADPSANPPKQTWSSWSGLSIIQKQIHEKWFVIRSRRQL